MPRDPERQQLCFCWWHRTGVCVCVCVCVCERENKCVCVCERERLCVYVCERVPLVPALLWMGVFGRECKSAYQRCTWTKTISEERCEPTGKKIPLGEYTPCTLFHFKVGKRPSRMKERGGSAEETSCQTTCAIALVLALPPQQENNGTYGTLDEVVISDGFCILNQHWYNVIYLWWHFLRRSCGHPVWPFSAEAPCDRSPDRKSPLVFRFFQKCNIIAETFHSRFYWLLVRLSLFFIYYFFLFLPVFHKRNLKM